MRKKILLMIVGILLINLVSGAELSYEPNKTMDLKIYCFDTDVDLCSGSVDCEISIFYPNMSVFVDNKSMSQTSNYFNYTASGTGTLGIYKAVVACRDGTSAGYIPFDFYVGRPSTAIQEGVTSRGIYLLLVIAVLCFLGFLFVDHTTIKWTFFLFSIFFIVMGINVSSISLYNEATNENIRNIFDTLGSISYYLYYFIFGMIIFIWIFSIFQTISSKRNMQQAASVGAPMEFR